jgi:hypothetical protein
VSPLSVATLVSYRRPGNSRGSPHQAILPGHVTQQETARDLLATLLGEVEQVRLLEVMVRAGAGVVVAPSGLEPEPFVLPGLRTVADPSQGLEPIDILICIMLPRLGLPSPRGRSTIVAPPTTLHSTATGACDDQSAPDRGQPSQCPAQHWTTERTR